MMNDCDFDVEHADGSFLDHLYFCFGVTTFIGNTAFVISPQ